MREKRSVRCRDPDAKPDIEAVAHDTPDKIHTIAIDSLKGIVDADVAKLNSAFKLEGQAAEDGKTLFPLLYNAYVDTDMSLLEINPLVTLKDGHLCVLDAKVSFDSNAMFRHPDIADHHAVKIGADMVFGLDIATSQNR